MNDPVEKAIRIGNYHDRLDDETVIRDITRIVRIIQGIPVEEDKIRFRISKIKNYIDILKKLPPGIEQRTPAWYAARENMVTGSELQSAIEGRKQFFENKLGGPDGWNKLKDNPAIKWGVKYEPVATELYERRNNCKVHEFGLLPHPVMPNVGASPDGITDLGIMLEIKCPFSRQITGKIKTDYATQIQMQLDTTELYECDFLECKIEEYKSVNDFVQDTSDSDPRLTKSGKEKGVIWKTDTDHEVSPDLTTEEMVKWAEERPGSSFWRIVIYNCVRVEKNESFIRDLKPKIEETLKKIAIYKSDNDRFKEDFGELKEFAFIL
ncbi:YqaJ-like viral recombinase [Tetraselmis virus 1]|uniref:YqaJ-like viral recombinase n=1 Tax=Tetraselmis virus 1 TaxID=2060617 RepID=A0A2P0VN12_9VIRU|nr:YqaJ-like viral recombinase [Tetraselmis virus 1]AUF82270.1 YqaJ-like viral recombinase [Tetraselmis virus 1]